MSYVPRVSRPLQANIYLLDGHNYEWLYKNFIVKYDVCGWVADIILSLAWIQLAKSMTPFSDLLDRMLDGEECDNIDILKNYARRLDRQLWRDFDVLSIYKRNQNNGKDCGLIIPFEYIKYENEVKSGKQDNWEEITESELEKIKKALGMCYLDIVRRKRSKIKTPHTDLLIKLIDGCDFQNSESALAQTKELDDMRRLSVSAAIRAYWRTADEEEENGGKPGTLSGMHAFLEDCGVSF